MPIHSSLFFVNRVQFPPAAYYKLSRICSFHSHVKLSCANSQRLQKMLCVVNKFQQWDLDRKFEPALGSLVLLLWELNASSAKQQPGIRISMQEMYCTIEALCNCIREINDMLNTVVQIVKKKEKKASSPSGHTSLWHERISDQCPHSIESLTFSWAEPESISNGISSVHAALKWHIIHRLQQRQQDTTPTFCSQSKPHCYVLFSLLWDPLPDQQINMARKMGLKERKNGWWRGNFQGREGVCEKKGKKRTRESFHLWPINAEEHLLYKSEGPARLDISPPLRCPGYPAPCHIHPRSLRRIPATLR